MGSNLLRKDERDHYYLPSIKMLHSTFIFKRGRKDRYMEYEYKLRYAKDDHRVKLTKHILQAKPKKFVFPY